jgi:hypothetical protein
MTRKKPQRNNRRKGPERLESVDNWQHEAEQPFEDDLDHTAYHAAEDLRNATDRWRQQGFMLLTQENLPPITQPLVNNLDDWKRLAVCIDRWSAWWLQQDIPGPLAAGRIKVEVAEIHDVRGIIFGYELQSGARQN